MGRIDREAPKGVMVGYHSGQKVGQNYIGGGWATGIPNLEISGIYNANC